MKSRLIRLSKNVNPLLCPIQVGTGNRIPIHAIDILHCCFDPRQTPSHHFHLLLRQRSVEVYTPCAHQEVVKVAAHWFDCMGRNMKMIVRARKTAKLSQSQPKGRLTCAMLLVRHEQFKRIHWSIRVCILVKNSPRLTLHRSVSKRIQI